MLENSPEGDARKVYVVDDDEAVRDSMRALLESWGMEVADFASAADFLARDGRADGCLLLDLHMPGMNGLELLEHMQQQGTLLPTIVITGRSDSVLKERALRAGALVLLDKPVDDDLLIASLERAFAFA
jgi:two-component system, LuxR family, response regulator FixJ